MIELSPQIMAGIGGTVSVGSLVLWMLKRQGDIIVAIARLEAKLDGMGEMRADLKGHERRLTLLEPKTEAAHKRLDDVVGSRH